MRRYLLGDLPESETNALEAEILRDDEKFEQMWELENRLVDDYVRGRLTPPDRARFERHYQASPIHRQRVAVARKLVDEADASRPAVVSWGARLSEKLGFSLLSWQSALAVGVVLFAMSSLWLFLDRSHLRRSQEQLRVENQSLQNREQVLSQKLATAQQESQRLESEIVSLLAEQNVNAQPPQQPTIFSLLLSPLLVRSDGAPQTVIPPPQTDLIRLQMAVDRDKAGRFQVSISTVEGRRVWEQQIRPGDGLSKNSIISAVIPGGKLPVGDYILTLSEINSTDEVQELNRYFFRVIRQ